jgi:hypothetical protein
MQQVFFLAQQHRLVWSSLFEPRRASPLPADWHGSVADVGRHAAFMLLVSE